LKELHIPTFFISLSVRSLDRGFFQQTEKADASLVSPNYLARWICYYEARCSVCSPRYIPQKRCYIKVFRD